MTHAEFAARAELIGAQIRTAGLAFDACAIAAKRPADSPDYLPYLVGAQAGLIVALFAVADAAHALLVDAGNDWPGPRE